MTDNESNIGKEQKFLRGLLFLATGTFLLLRLAAAGNNPFFVGAMWFVGLVALLAFGLLIWEYLYQP